MGLLSLFAKPKKASAPEYRELPAYAPSKYDAPSAEQLYGTYSTRARGEGVGFTPEDLSTMKAQETDQQVRSANEYQNRSMAGRRMTGGVTSGGTNRIRDRALLQTGVAKSQALRDIAIRNAVLKREETWQGIQGLDSFLQNERGEAWRKTSYESQRTGDYNANQRYGQEIVNQNRGGYNQWLKSNLDSVENTVKQVVLAGVGGYSGGAAGAGAAKSGAAGSTPSSDVDYNSIYGYKPLSYNSVVGAQNYRYR